MASIGRKFFGVGIVVVVLLEAVSGTDIKVGGPMGWDLDIDYKAWAATQTFNVGDNLIFEYDQGYHTVVEVTRAKFEECDARLNIFEDDSGITKIPLTEPGKRYFICNMLGHCAGGMKLAVDVLQAGEVAPVQPPSPPASPPSKVLPPAPSPEHESSAEGMKVAARSALGMLLLIVVMFNI